MVDEGIKPPDQRAAEIKELAKELAKPISRGEIEASISVPGAIHSSSDETEGLIMLFAPHKIEAKSQTRFQTAQRMVDVLQTGTEENPVELFNQLGRSFGWLHIRGAAPVSNEAKVKITRTAANLIEKAASNFPPDSDPLLYPRINPASSDQEREARVYAFYGILSVCAEKLGQTHDLSPAEFGVRVAPAVVGAFGRATEIASRYPEPEVIKYIVGL